MVQLSRTFRISVAGLLFLAGAGALLSCVRTPPETVDGQSAEPRGDAQWQGITSGYESPVPDGETE